MTFELTSELTLWTARLSMIVFALAFLYDGLRNGQPLIKYLWQGFAVLQGLYFTLLILYHIIISELPPFDLLNGLLAIASLMTVIIILRAFKSEPQKNNLFAPAFASYYLAVVYTALPISRILPAETNALIYYVMLYAMMGVLTLRIVLDIIKTVKRKRS